MTPRASAPPPLLVLSEWERDVMTAAAMIQVDRHLAGTLVARDDMKADRWREIAAAISAGRAIAYQPPRMRGGGAVVDG